MPKPLVTLDVGSDGVGVISINNPPVNALSIPVIDALKQKFDEGMRRNDVKAILLTGDGGRFSSGFDISVFQEIHKTGNISLLPSVTADLVVNGIEDGRKPVVAAVEGIALGGGLELAMGCHARVAAPKAQLNLPELTLGVIPGFGGTQRLPRLIGLSKAVQIMLSSKPISSEEGLKLGLIDKIASSEDLLNISRQWALDIAERRKPRVRSLHRTDRIGTLLEALEILIGAREYARQSAPTTPQHQACLDAIEYGIIHGGYSGVLMEEKLFSDLVLSDTAKGLVHAFFAQRGISKVPSVTNIGLKPRHVKRVAVIGGGLMGSGIATDLILGGINVVLKEVNSEYLQKGLKMIAENVGGLVTRRSLSQDRADNALSLLKGVLDYAEFKHVDMVIEAVTENVQLKQKIFSELETVCNPHCTLATNTSTIDLNVVGQKTRSNDRIVGAHFFSPARAMQLLEIVRTDETSAQVILDLMAVGKVIKKAPVVVRNCTGFAMNRTFFPYAQGAQLLAHLGVDIFRIDRVITNFGLPMGPFQLKDLIGYGVGLAVFKEFTAAYPDRVFKSPLTDLMIKSGRNGKRNGKGFYIYEKGRKTIPDTSVLQIVNEARRLTNILPGGKPVSVSDQDILEMVLFPVVNEACRVLAEGIVVRASDLDISSVLGMGFPSYHGGIIFWADLIGPKHIYTSLKKWYEAYGNFYKPSSFLEERAIKGIPLGHPVSATTSRSRI